MELDNLIPKKYKHLSDAWKVNGNILMFKKYEYIPLCVLSDDVVYILFDLKVKKQIIELVKHLMKLSIEFYFTTTEFTNPGGIIDFNNKVIKSYFLQYSNYFFYKSLNDIGFDLISNMVQWANKNNCYELIKPNLKEVAKIIEREDYDYYSNKITFEYDKEVRDMFKDLYRDIQISQIVD